MKASEGTDGSRLVFPIEEETLIMSPYQLLYGLRKVVVSRGERGRALDFHLGGTLNYLS